MLETSNVSFYLCTYKDVISRVYVMHNTITVGNLSVLPPLALRQASLCRAFEKLGKQVSKLLKIANREFACRSLGFL